MPNSTAKSSRGWEESPNNPKEITKSNNLSQAWDYKIKQLAAIEGATAARKKGKKTRQAVEKRTKKEAKNLSNALEKQRQAEKARGEAVQNLECALNRVKHAKEVATRVDDNRYYEQDDGDFSIFTGVSRLTTGSARSSSGRSLSSLKNKFNISRRSDRRKAPLSVVPVIKEVTQEEATTENATAEEVTAEEGIPEEGIPEEVTTEAPIAADAHLLDEISQLKSTVQMLWGQVYAGGNATTPPGAERSGDDCREENAGVQDKDAEERDSPEGKGQAERDSLAGKGQVSSALGKHQRRPKSRKHRKERTGVEDDIVDGPASSESEHIGEYQGCLAFLACANEIPFCVDFGKARPMDSSSSRVRWGTVERRLRTSLKDQEPELYFGNSIVRGDPIF